METGTVKWFNGGCGLQSTNIFKAQLIKKHTFRVARDTDVLPE